MRDCGEQEGYGPDNRQMPRVEWGREMDFRKCDISYSFPAKFPQADGLWALKKKTVAN